MTKECNLRCRYCYQKRFSNDSLSVATAVETFHAAAESGVTSLALTFFGGEPLLRADAIFEIMAAARHLERSRGISVTAKISTNGILLDEGTLSRAQRWGIFVSLSIDGTEQAHNIGRVDRDGHGSYEAADRALRLLAAAGKPFAVYSVITPVNVKYLADSIAFLWNAGARIIINTVDYTADWTEEARDRLERQYHRTGRFYRRQLERGEFFHMDPFDSRIPAVTRPRELKRCQPGLSQVVVAPDGTIYGCLEFFYRRLMPVGTSSTWIDRRSVQHLVQTRRGLPVECGDCALEGRCNNRCACINLRGTDTPNRPPSSLCLCEQATLFAVDRTAEQLYRKRVPEFVLRNYSCSYHLLTGIERLLQGMEKNDEQAHTG